MLPGECGHDGKQCPDCKQELNMQILQSAAGYYLGTQCNCGPFSRESGYFKTREEIMIKACTGIELRDGRIFQSSRL